MLNQKIRLTIQSFRTQLPADLSALLEQGAGEISALDINERSRKVGDKAPEFDLENQYGERRRLPNYLQEGPLVITFYRGVWCPYSDLQLREYDSRLEEFKAAGARLVAITPEKTNVLDTLAAGGASSEVVDIAPKQVGFDVLHDPGCRVAEEYGLVSPLPETHRQLLDMLGVDIQELNGDSAFTFPDPVTYVIDQTGKVSWAFVPETVQKHAMVDQILLALR